MIDCLVPNKTHEHQSCYLFFYIAREIGVIFFKVKSSEIAIQIKSYYRLFLKIYLFIILNS